MVPLQYIHSLFVRGQHLLLRASIHCWHTYTPATWYAWTCALIYQHAFTLTDRVALRTLKTMHNLLVGAMQTVYVMGYAQSRPSIMANVCMRFCSLCCLHKLLCFLLLCFHVCMYVCVCPCMRDIVYKKRKGCLLFWMEGSPKWSWWADFPKPTLARWTSPHARY